MENKNTIRLKEVKKTDAYDNFCREIYSHTIVLYFECDDDAGGSGTLVTYGPLKGVLTAPHAIAPLKDWNHVWIPYILHPGTTDIWLKCPVPFRRILAIDKLDSFLIPDSPWDEGQLDIALIEIEESVFNHLCTSSGKSPIDLTILAKKFRACPKKYCHPSNAHDWSWPISGFPREAATLSLDLCATVYRYDGVYTGGGITRIRPLSLTKVRADFQGFDADLVVSEIGPTDDDLPSDFSGMSGGGQWQISLAESKGIVSVGEIFLSGVFIGANEKEKRLYSRGSNSLYTVFCDYLDKIIAAES